MQMMIASNAQRISRKQFHAVSIVLFFMMILFSSSLKAQHGSVTTDRYILTDGQELQIIVHIWGEVKNPGQYIVPDGTNVLELISLAGGPNEYSNLGDVKLTRHYYDGDNNENGAEKWQLGKKMIYNVNLDKYLSDKDYEYVYTLKPGDVVKVNRNSWFRFQTFIKVIYQVAIIAQGLYYWTQIVN